MPIDSVGDAVFNVAGAAPLSPEITPVPVGVEVRPGADPVTSWENDPVAQALGVSDFDRLEEGPQDDQAENRLIVGEMKRLLSLDPKSPELSPNDHELFAEYGHLVTVRAIDRERCGSADLADLLDEEEELTRSNVMALLSPIIYKAAGSPDIEDEAAQMAAEAEVIDDWDERLRQAEDRAA